MIPTTEILEVIELTAVQPVTEDSTFEELNLGDVERDAIALDIENHLGIHVCDKDARAWMSVGDVLRCVARQDLREAMA